MILNVLSLMVHHYTVKNVLEIICLKSFSTCTVEPMMKTVTYSQMFDHAYDACMQNAFIIQNNCKVAVLSTL